MVARVRIGLCVWFVAMACAAPARIIDGRSGDQRFFPGFAQNWRTLWRDQILRQLTTRNPHSPDAIRVRTVRDFDPWYGAFDIKPGDTQFLAPSERVRIW
jgi:putative endopeptidase